MPINCTSATNPLTPVYANHYLNLPSPSSPDKLPTKANKEQRYTRLVDTDNSARRWIGAISCKWETSAMPTLQTDNDARQE
jgi:hypothetical protein